MVTAFERADPEVRRLLAQHQRAEALRRRSDGEPLADIARSYAVDRSMISR